jgi:hypothetical protein
MQHLWELAEVAHKRLPTMTPAEQKEVLALLDVRVTSSSTRRRREADVSSNLRGCGSRA